MKLMKSLTISMALASIAFAACNGSADKKAYETKTDSPAAEAPAAPAKPANVMVAKFKVSNYAKWLAGYETADSFRLAHGLHKFVISRGALDSTLVMVTTKMDDPEKAKAFAALPELKKRMQSEGVQGAPAFMFLDVQMMDTSTTNTPLRLSVSHKVKDYDAWKKVFDEDKTNRMNAGLTDRVLSYEVGNKNMVHMSFIVSDKKKADDMMNSKELKDKMAAGGVEGAPSILYYNVVKKY